MANDPESGRDRFPGLNERQNKFVWHIIEGKSAKEAYIAAGYKARGNSAETKASRLVRKGQVQDALARAREELAERTLITKGYVMQNLREVAQRCMVGVEIYDKEGNPTGVWQFNPQGANKALELMGKELGMFKDKLEHSGSLPPISQITVVKHYREDD